MNVFILNLIGLALLICLFMIGYYIIRLVFITNNNYSPTHRVRLNQWSKCIILISVIGVLIELYFKV